MFISIIFNTEYFDVPSRSKWYLRHLLFCKEQGGVMITHESLYNNLLSLQNEISESLFESWEMKPFSIQEIESVEQYTIPDRLFDDIETFYGGRSEMLNVLFSEPNERLESYLEAIVQQIREKHQSERIEFVFHPLDVFKSVSDLFVRYHIPIVRFSFSAIRKPHGYMQTLYYATYKRELLCSKECEARYYSFLEENTDFPILNNKELIALIGKERTLPLISLIGAKPKYDMCICGECFRTQPQLLAHGIHTTDDDLYYYCSKLYDRDSIITRQHSLLMDQIRVSRTEVHNDPATTILSSKRTVAVCSQIMLKVLIWDRTAIMPVDTVPFGFMCVRDYLSEKKVDLRALNYYLFGFLVPSSLIYDVEYWKWRITNPTETEIYKCHLDFLFNALGINKEKVMQLSGKERLRYLLESRHCDEQLIENVLSDETIDNINWDVASSKFEVVTEEGAKTYWRIDTENAHGSLTANLSVDVKDAKAVKFYPLDDVAGFAKLNSVMINGKEFATDSIENQFAFMPKNKGCFTFPLDEVITGKLQVECVWEYKKVFEYLNNQGL